MEKKVSDVSVNMWPADPIKGPTATLEPGDERYFSDATSLKSAIGRFLALYDIHEALYLGLQRTDSGIRVLSFAGDWEPADDRVYAHSDFIGDNIFKAGSDIRVWVARMGTWGFAKDFADEPYAREFL